MSRGINKVILVGNLGKDPEMRYLPSGAAVCNFSIATSESWKDKQTGEQKERTEWHDIEVWGNQAEACGKYLSKGSQCYVEGKLQTESWEKDGMKKYRTKIRADNTMFIGSRAGSPNHEKPEPARQEPMDDDIPF